MTWNFAHIRKGLGKGLAAFIGAGSMFATPLAAQSIESVDPDAAMGQIDGDLDERPGDAPIYAESPTVAAQAAQTAQQSGSSVDNWTVGSDDMLAPEWSDPVATSGDAATAASQAVAGTAAAQGGTYRKDDLIGAAEGVFGKGAEGVARMIEGLLEEQGEPNGYIVGREGGGAFIVGARYGSGTLYHAVEGEMPVYWTGPSIGFDIGANASNTFVLVYNLHDTDELYERYPAGEGQAYLVGGMNASYLRKGDVVLIPIRVGAGLRLGVNAGYMRFSRKQRWLPF